VGLDLTGTGTVIVVGLSVEVAAETADLAAVTWVEDDRDTGSTIPLDGDSVVQFDVGVKSGVSDLVLGLGGDSSLATDDWLCAKYEMEDCVVM
jgi:hypothetical protein